MITLGQTISDNNMRMITLTVITISGALCINCDLHKLKITTLEKFYLHFVLFLKVRNSAISNDRLKIYTCI